MMKIEVIDIKGLINIIDVVASVIGTTEDLMINAFPDYIQIHQTNLTRTSLISVNMSKEMFDGFQCDKEFIIVPIAGVQSTLDMFIGFKRLIIELDRLHGLLTFYAKDGRKKKQTTLKLITEGDEFTDNVNLDYKTIVKVNTIEFKNAIKDCVGIGNFIVFKSTNTELKIVAKGDMGSNEETWYTGENMDVLTADDTLSAFPAKDISAITNKTEKISEKVIISLLTGSPITMVYDFKGGTIKAIVAPVLDEEVLNIE